MILHIRNMKSERCKILVRSELEKLNLLYQKVEIGEVEVKGNPTRAKLLQFNNALRCMGLELMDSEKILLVKRIKNTIKEYIFLSDGLHKENFTDFVSKKLKLNYVYLSNLFSSQQGVTIEKYIIEQKIERVKELLAYSELSVNDIAFKLHYSSVAHLSNQFKKITGLTPSFFRQLRNKSLNSYKLVLF